MRWTDGWRTDVAKPNGDDRTRDLAGLSLGPAGYFTGLAVLEKRCR